MKNIILILAFLTAHFFSSGQTYNPTNFTVTNKSYGLAQAAPTDARSYFFDASKFSMRPYQSTAEVIAYLNLAKYRVGNFPIFINNGGVLQSNGTFVGGTIDRYSFKDGTANSNLVLETVDVNSVFSDPRYRDTLATRVTYNYLKTLGVKVDNTTIRSNSDTAIYATPTTVQQTNDSTAAIITNGNGDTYTLKIFGNAISPGGGTATDTTGYKTRILAGPGISLSGSDPYKVVTNTRTGVTDILQGSDSSYATIVLTDGRNFLLHIMGGGAPGLPEVLAKDSIAQHFGIYAREIGVVDPINKFQAGGLQYGFSPSGNLIGKLWFLNNGGGQTYLSSVNSATDNIDLRLPATSGTLGASVNGVPFDESGNVNVGTYTPVVLTYLGTTYVLNPGANIVLPFPNADQVVDGLNNHFTQWAAIPGGISYGNYISANAPVYTSGGYGTLVRNATTGRFEVVNIAPSQIITATGVAYYETIPAFSSGETVISAPGAVPGDVASISADVNPVNSMFTVIVLNNDQAIIRLNNYGSAPLIINDGGVNVKIKIIR